MLPRVDCNKAFQSTLTAVACLACSASVVFAQSPSALKFEVASVRQIEYTEQVRDEVLAGTRRDRTTVTDSRVSITYTSLAEIVRRAFRLLDQPWRLAAPEWLNGSRFDVQATIPAGARTDQVPEMLQALLAERFALVTRRESREVRGHALVVRGDTAKLREMTPQELEELERLRQSGKPEAQTTRTETSALTFRPTAAGSILQADVKGMSMSELARELTGAVGAPVVDRTGLAGRYHFTLEMPMPDLASVVTGRGGGAAGSGRVRPSRRNSNDDERNGGCRPAARSAAGVRPDTGRSRGCRQNVEDADAGLMIRKRAKNPYFTRNSGTTHGSVPSLGPIRDPIFARLCTHDPPDRVRSAGSALGQSLPARSHASSHAFRL